MIQYENNLHNKTFKLSHRGKILHGSVRIEDAMLTDLDVIEVIEEGAKGECL